MRTDIVIVDDHSLILEGLKSLLSSSFEESSVYIAQNASQLLSLMKQYQFSVFIVDIALPDMDGFDLIHIIKSQSPEAKIIVSTMHEEVMDSEQAEITGNKRSCIQDLSRNAHSGCGKDCA